MSKRKIFVEDKIYAVNMYLDGKESQHRIASMLEFRNSRTIDCFKQIVIGIE